VATYSEAEVKEMYEATKQKKLDWAGKKLSVISDARKTYTPGWTVKDPDGQIVDKCDSPIAATMTPDAGLFA
jgi:hypothetical protein